MEKSEHYERNPPNLTVINEDALCNFLGCQYSADCIAHPGKYGSWESPCPRTAWMREATAPVGEQTPLSEAVITSIASYAQTELGLKIRPSEIESLMNGIRPIGMDEETYKDLRYQGGFAISLDRNGCLEDPITHPEKFSNFLNGKKD